MATSTNKTVKYDTSASSLTRGGVKSSEFTKTVPKGTALKAKEALQSFVNNYRNVAEFEQARNAALRAIADITDIYERPDTIPAMSEGLKNTNRNANTLIGAIRDNIFNAKGFNSMLADQRRGQVLDILGATPNTSSSSKGSTSTSQAGNTKPDFFETSGVTKKIAEEEDTVADPDVIEYTYKPGDTFGQVINNLGLRTTHGLWGPDGDVEYYTQQLIDQGLWPNGVRGNIPVGATIKLRRRK